MQRELPMKRNSHAARERTKAKAARLKPPLQKPALAWFLRVGLQPGL